MSEYNIAFLSKAVNAFAGAATFAGSQVALTADGAEFNTTYAGVTTTRFKTEATGGLISVDGANALRLRSNGVDRLTVVAGTGAIAVSGAFGVAGVASLADGAVGTPGLCFSGDPDSGLYRIGANNLGLTLGGVKLLDFGPGALGLTGALTVSNGLTVSSGTTAVGILNAAGAVDAPSYTLSAWKFADYTGTRVFIGGGASQFTEIGFRGNNVERWRMDSSGHFIAVADNTYDIGASGATRPRDGYFARNVTVGGLLSTAASATGGAGLRLAHGTAPTSPVNGDVWTTTAGLFVRVNGATVGPLS